MCAGGTLPSIRNLLRLGTPTRHYRAGLSHAAPSGLELSGVSTPPFPPPRSPASYGRLVFNPRLDSCSWGAMVRGLGTGHIYERHADERDADGARCFATAFAACRVGNGLGAGFRAGTRVDGDARRMASDGAWCDLRRLQPARRTARRG